MLFRSTTFGNEWKDIFCYYLDVLTDKSRHTSISKPTRIVYNTFNNLKLLDMMGEQYLESFENFNSDFALLEKDNKQAKSRLSQLIRFLFTPFDFLSFEQRRRLDIANNHIFNLDSKATMIFTPANKAGQTKFASLLREVLGQGYVVKVLNGDYTCNADCEEECKQIFKDHPDQHVIFISCNMGSRSFSIGEIKNIIILTESMAENSFSQKLARGLTQHSSIDFVTCIDCLASVGASNILGLLSQTKSNIDDSIEEQVNNIKFALDNELIMIKDYFNSGDNPFKQYNYEEILNMETLKSGDGRSLRDILDIDIIIKCMKHAGHSGNLYEFVPVKRKSIYDIQNRVVGANAVVKEIPQIDLPSTATLERRQVRIVNCIME